MKQVVNEALTRAASDKPLSEDHQLKNGASLQCLFLGCPNPSLDGCHYCEQHREVNFLEAGCRSLRAYTLDAERLETPDLLSHITCKQTRHSQCQL